MPVFTTRPDTLFGATFFVLAPEHPLVAAADRAPSEVREYVRHAAARYGGRARAEGEGRRLHRAARGQPGQRRADPDLGRRLRAHGVRHRRDHGRARPRRARLRLRRAVRPADPPGRRAGATATVEEGEPYVAHTEDEVLVNSGEFTGMPAPEAQAGDRRVARRARRGRGDHRLPPARLAALAPALLGLPDPDRPLRARAAIVPVPDDELPVVLPGGRGLPAEGPLAAGGGRGLGATSTCPRCGGPAGARRTRWTRSSTRPGTSSATPTRTTTGAVRPREIVDYWLPGQPVHRRRRARDPAPALRALLHEGDAGDGPASASASRSRGSSTRG